MGKYAGMEPMVDNKRLVDFDRKSHWLRLIFNALQSNIIFLVLNVMQSNLILELK